MTSPSSPEGSGLIERALADAKWLEAFVHSNTGMTGHDWKKRGRAEQHVEDVYQLTQAASALSAYEAVVRAAQHAVSVGSRVSLKTERTEAFKALRAALEQSGEGLGSSVARVDMTPPSGASADTEGH